MKRNCRNERELKVMCQIFIFCSGSQGSGDTITSSKCYRKEFGGEWGGGEGSDFSKQSSVCQSVMQTRLRDLGVREPSPKVSLYNMMTEDAISVAISWMKSSPCVLDPVPDKLFGVGASSLTKKTCYHTVLFSWHLPHLPSVTLQWYL